MGIIATKMIGETFDIQVLDPIQSLFAVLIVLGGGVLLSVSKLKRENAL